LENGNLTRPWRTHITARNITPDQFHDRRKDDGGALQEKHADAIHRMYEIAGLNLKTASEAEKASLRLRQSGQRNKPTWASARQEVRQVGGLVGAQVERNRDPRIGLI
jgi:hypothetical protein